MGKIKEISYEQVVRGRQYETLRIGATIEVNEQEDANVQALKLQTFVVNTLTHALDDYWVQLGQKNPDSQINSSRGTTIVKEPIQLNTIGIPNQEMIPNNSNSNFDSRLKDLLDNPDF